MPVVPVITTTAETTLRWTIDGESYGRTVSIGTWEIPELELRHGENTVSVTSEGITTFTYREGRYKAPSESPRFVVYSISTTRDLSLMKRITQWSIITFTIMEMEYRIFCVSA